MNKLLKYKVAAKSITGLGRTAFLKGSTVTKDDFFPNVVEGFVEAGFLVPIKKEEVKIEELVSLPDVDGSTKKTRRSTKK